MASLFPAHSLAGDWTQWRVVCKVALCNPHRRCTTVGRTHLDEWSTHRRDLNLATHNTHNRETSMPPAGFETTISANKWPQTHTSPCGHWHQPFWHLVDIKYSSKLSFTAPVSNILKCSFVICVWKSESGVWKCGLFESRMSGSPMSENQGLPVLLNIIGL